MSKGNLFLGFGRGAVGDVVFSHQNGEQVARARNRSPRNPKSALQLLQRVCMKTVAQSYSVFQDITNHSFQGAAEGTESQSRYTKANVDMLRANLAVEIESGDWDEILNSAQCNYASRASSGAEFMPFIISEGSLNPIQFAFNSYSLGETPMVNAQLKSPSGASLGQSSPTYQNVVDFLGCNRGDQLTFIFCSIDDTQETGQFNGFEYCRVILEPAGGDMSVAFLSGGAVNDPNPRNRPGSLAFSTRSQGSSHYLEFSSVAMSMNKGAANSVGAIAVIVSRLVGGTEWARSSQSLLLRSDIITDPTALEFNHSVDTLGDAIRSYMADANSSLYLNQAET